MSGVAAKVREFVSKLDEVWRRMVIDPLQYESEEVWGIRDTVPEVCNNLIVTAALIVLAYYDHVTRRLKRERSPSVDTLLNKLLYDAADPTPMTGAQALTILEWSLESDTIPLLRRDSLKARHVIFLSVFARQRTDPHHRDYQRYFEESSAAPLADLVGQALRAVSFIADVRPEIQGSTYAEYSGPPKLREKMRFPLGPFFVQSDRDLLPFWRFDAAEQKYVYQSLWSNRELRRPKPTRVEAVKGQRLVTALLSSSYRSLAELARIASWFLQKHRTSLYHVATGGDGRTGSKRFNSEEFDRDPLLGTWRLITEHGPIGLLERDGLLAEYVFRQVHAADDDAAIRELEARTTAERVTLERLLAVEAARLLGLEVHPTNEVGRLEQLSEQCGSDLAALDTTADGQELVRFADGCLAGWSRAIERVIRFLIVFYLNLPYRRGGNGVRISAEGLALVFVKRLGLVGMWNRFESIVVGDAMVSGALFEFTGRSAVMEPSECKTVGALVHALANVRNPRVHYKHDDEESRMQMQKLRCDFRAFLQTAQAFIEMLGGGGGNAARPVYPYVLSFKTATFTSGGLTTLQYSSRLAGTPGGHSDVVVYTSRPIEVARVYYCLPRAGQSAFGGGDQKSILVDPLLVAADLIDPLVPEPEAEHDAISA